MPDNDQPEVDPNVNDVVEGSEEQGSEQVEQPAAQTVPLDRLNEVIAQRNADREALQQAHQQLAYASQLLEQAKAQAQQQVQPQAPNLNLTAEQRLAKLIKDAASEATREQIAGLQQGLFPLYEQAAEAAKIQFQNANKNVPPAILDQAETVFKQYTDPKNPQRVPGLTRETALIFARGLQQVQLESQQAEQVNQSRQNLQTINQIAKGKGNINQPMPGAPKQEKDKTAAELSAELRAQAERGSWK